MLGQHQDARVGGGGLDAPGRFQAAHALHADIHDRPIRTLLSERRHGFVSVAALSDVPRQMAEGAPQQSPHFLMVIDDQNFHLDRAWWCSEEALHEMDSPVHPRQPAKCLRAVADGIRSRTDMPAVGKNVNRRTSGVLG